MAGGLTFGVCVGGVLPSDDHEVTDPGEAFQKALALKQDQEPGGDPVQILLWTDFERDAKRTVVCGYEPREAEALVRTLLRAIRDGRAEEPDLTARAVERLQTALAAEEVLRERARPVPPSSRQHDRETTDLEGAARFERDRAS